MTTTSMPVHPDLEREFEMVQARAALLAIAETAVAEHAARKCDTRTAAVLRIMAQPAPSGKPHSWSSAEALRDTDTDYAAWKRDELRLAQVRGAAETALFCARLRAEYLSRTLPPRTYWESGR